MNGGKQEYRVALLATLEIFLIPISTVSLGRTQLFQTTVGQQEDLQELINSTDSISNRTIDIENQSTALVDPRQNQTVANQTGTAALSANLTESDFELLRQDLSGARQAFRK
jgi:hypothetical protein